MKFSAALVLAVASLVAAAPLTGETSSYLALPFLAL